MYRHFHDTELYEFGMATHLAVNSPKELRKLEPKRLAAEIAPEELPGMLRIPKKRPKVEDNGG